ncbi:NXPE family member 1-like [Pelodytes ibericus]
MSISDTRGFKAILVISVVVILGLIYCAHQKLVQPQSYQFLKLSYSEQNVPLVDSTEPNASDKEPDFLIDLIDQMFNAINQTIPNVSFTMVNKTTSGKSSTAFILHNQETYCIGDSLTIRVYMFDYLGKRKTYGGDFLRARIYSNNIEAGASGRIEDLNNGSYNIYFTLSWEGNVNICIKLMHPSEGVSVLWKARNMGYKNIIFTGKFLNKTQEVHRECGFYLESQEEKCEYEDKQYGDIFYCYKPSNVPCEALISMMSNNRPHSYLTDPERDIFTRSNIGVEIPTNVRNIDVLKCQRNSTDVKPKCRIGMSPPIPGGYFLKNNWYPHFCQLLSEPLRHTDTCLSGKMIYLLGDSTLRQWIQYFPKLLKSLKFFDLHGNGQHKELLAMDLERNIYIKWKRHGHPFVTQSFYTVKDYASIPKQLDQLSGGSHMIIVITLGQHFRPFPISLFIRRILNIRKAIERLLARSPDTKVVIKSENTREINTNAERFSDFHGYIQYLLVKNIFKGLNVGMIDAWDMTVACDSYEGHPSDNVIMNEINMFLAYVC